MIHTVTLDPPAWNKNEIMRYARINRSDPSFDTLIDACIKEAEPLLTYRVCYTIIPISIDGILQIGHMTINSITVKKAIRQAKEIILFAATVGAPFDRLIRRYSSIAPSKALLYQAIGAERVESLCDAFCDRMNTELFPAGKSLTPRVSPGYGDIELELQREIFSVLDCPRKIGLTLDDSLLMSPSKSVTAIAGIVEGCQEHHASCESCNKADCVYRC